jgi:putative FmdB family regulatory protein
MVSSTFQCSPIIREERNGTDKKTKEGRPDMPTYEYSCVECQEEFELMRPMCDFDKDAKCPKCGGKAHRLVSVFASKADYSIKVPTKEAFRGEKTGAAVAKSKASAKPAKRAVNKSSRA